MRILAIDDDPEALWLVWATLRSGGHEAVRAGAAAELEPLLAGDEFDAVVLDLEMPERSGLDVLEELRSRPSSKHLPVLFLSAHADSKSRVAGLRRGADDYLTKPFEPEELLLRLEKLVSGREPAKRKTLDFAALDARIVDGRLIGEVALDRYLLERVIGRGAMGMVFLARDPRLERRLAVKTLRPDSSLPDEQRRRSLSRLREEARVLASLNHPNVVAIYDTGSDDDEIPYIAMELVDGPSLDEILELSALSVAATVALGEKIALGLAAAHGAGVLHRDIKPENVLLGRDGAIKLSDFGVAVPLARIAEWDEGVFGTPGFIAPEMFRGEPTSFAADLFSFGALLYRCLTGRAPFSGRTLQEIMTRTCNLAVEPPSVSVEGVPAELDDLILALLAKEAAARPPSMAWVADELARLGRPLGARWRPSVALLDDVLRRRTAAGRDTLAIAAGGGDGATCEGAAGE